MVIRKKLRCSVLVEDAIGPRVSPDIFGSIIVDREDRGLLQTPFMRMLLRSGLLG